jgi:2,3-bisphosphoglycerate-independent phosphoglycerate mutase
MHKRTPTALIILDGFGYSEKQEGNAIYQAHPPTWLSWRQRYPFTLLQASGEAVGLLPGMIGSSEVGHLTLGAGRVIKQPITALDEIINNGLLRENKLLQSSYTSLKKHNATLHIVGLLSDAGVHSHEKLAYALIEDAVQRGINKIVLHLFLDGRDVPPKSAILYLQKMELIINHLHNSTVIIGSLHGRFYAMDRDNNWDRTKQSFEVLLGKTKHSATTWQAWLEQWYAQGITDEFIPPVLLNEAGIIKKDDGVVFFNIRPERMEQLVNLVASEGPPLSFIITATSYGNNKHITGVLYERPCIAPTLLDTIAAAGLTIFTIAESEKYAQVTYYINGERTVKRPQETQVMIPSLRATNYINAPQMSASSITEAVINSLKTKPCDFYLINYANADMVGHSGNLAATIQAISCLDKELTRLYDAFIIDHKGALFITADHGNAEEKWDEQSQQPRTAHTTNPVPFFMITPSGQANDQFKHATTLADVGPCIISYLKSSSKYR